jgi:predicted AAA+ superfamily ATPase
MFARRMRLPPRSFFLFGPRATGKTTWLKHHLAGAAWFDLLRSNEYLRLLRDPDVFRQRVLALPRRQWVVVDEIQRLPTLLNEIHSIMNDSPGKYRFALTGSSARKLKRADVNLLAGRTINRRFFPLVGAELAFRFETNDLLRFGCLPAIRSARSQRARTEILEAYVDNYIREEIQQEALVKNLDSFSRFLEVAGIMNAQVTNVAGLARDAAVSRPTVQGYFDVLVDTLIGFWLPAWIPRAKVKESRHPKFYFFDPGVVRTISGRARSPLAADERGALFETLILHELRAWIDVSGCGGKLHYWRTPSGTEVDFVWSRGAEAIAIEVKSGAVWRPEFSRGLTALSETRAVYACFGVYDGRERLRDGPIVILPLADFMRELARGHVLPGSIGRGRRPTSGSRAAPRAGPATGRRAR